MASSVAASLSCSSASLIQRPWAAFSSASVSFRRSSRGSLQIRCAAAQPQTLETVQKIIATQLSVNEADVKPESKFADLGADSLDTVEIMMNLEENFKISLGEEGAEKIVTVQDAADMIQDVISKS